MSRSLPIGEDRAYGEVDESSPPNAKINDTDLDLKFFSDIYSDQ